MCFEIHIEKKESKHFLAIYHIFPFHSSHSNWRPGRFDSIYIFFCFSHIFLARRKAKKNLHANTLNHTYPFLRFINTLQSQHFFPFILQKGKKWIYPINYFAFLQHKSGLKRCETVEIVQFFGNLSNRKQPLRVQINLKRTMNC